MPGVGSYSEAIKNLEKKKLINPIIKHIKNKKPF